MKDHPMIDLMPLPYAADALAPQISKATLETHHGKHHAGYVKKTQAAIEGTALADATLEDIIAAAGADKDMKLFNQAAQVWNHGFYWHSLSPDAAEPSADLAAAIKRDHGSLDALLKDLGERATAHFASGWVWLADQGGKIVIEERHDAATLATGEIKPLLVIDVWEHAYYLDRKNARDAYVAAVIGDLLNWTFASENFSRQENWTYPA
jgi:Fe-Mn family superoxide dismutase